MTIDRKHYYAISLVVAGVIVAWLAFGYLTMKAESDPVPHVNGATGIITIHLGEYKIIGTRRYYFLGFRTLRYGEPIYCLAFLRGDMTTVEIWLCSDSVIYLSGGPYTVVEVNSQQITLERMK